MFIIQLFSAAAFAPLFAAWTLTIAAPLGALQFLERRENLRAPAGEGGVMEPVLPRPKS